MQASPIMGRFIFGFLGGGCLGGQEKVKKDQVNKVA